VPRVVAGRLIYSETESVSNCFSFYRVAEPYTFQDRELLL
jgi:hypothetical protein